MAPTKRSIFEEVY